MFLKYQMYSVLVVAVDLAEGSAPLPPVFAPPAGLLNIF